MLQISVMAVSIFSSVKYALMLHPVSLRNIRIAVLIALPDTLHFPVGKFFIENGKHVLMGKPLCVKEAQCLELTRLAQQKGVTLSGASFLFVIFRQIYPKIIPIFLNFSPSC